MIGAGAAGIGAAVELRRRGIDATVIERTDGIGSSWARRYDGLHLNTVRCLSAPRHSRIPRGAGRWPAREALLEHLRGLADREGLEVELGTAVDRIDRTEDGYALTTSAGPRRARFVVVATGYDHSPSIPAWPGRDGFEGTVTHASEYRNAADLEGRDVLVVGAGNTGTEIAVQLSRAGAGQVWIAVRTPPNIVPLEFLGVPITLLARFSEGQPAAFSDAFGRVMQRLAWGDLTRHGLPRSPYGIGTELKVRGLGAVVDRGFVAGLKAGEIEVVPAVESFDGPDVRLAGGRFVHPQAVIAATGYRMGLESLVGHLGVLLPSGKPACMRGEADPEAPGLHFNGYWMPASGQLPAMRRTTRRIGREIGRANRRGVD